MKNANVNEITCREAVALIAEHIDKYAGAIDRAALEHHLETCRSCFDRVEFEQMLKKRLAAIKTPGKSETLRRNVEALLEEY